MDDRDPIQKLPVISHTEAVSLLLDGTGKEAFERALPEFLQRQRWYGAKARTLRSVHVVNHWMLSLAGGLSPAWWLLIDVEFEQGDPELYQLPVCLIPTLVANQFMHEHPRGVILRVHGAGGEEIGVVCDAIWSPLFWRTVLTAYGTQAKFLRDGIIAFEVPTHIRERLAEGSSQIDLSRFTIHGGEQSNTSVIIDGQLILKLYRKVIPGENPELEIGRFLTEKTSLKCVPRMAGAIVYHPESSSKIQSEMTLGIIHETVKNQGDAWTHTLKLLADYFSRVRTISPVRGSLLDVSRQVPREDDRNRLGDSIIASRQLGLRTAELHLALSSGTGPAFAAEALTESWQQAWHATLLREARNVFDLLKRKTPELPEEIRPFAQKLISLESRVINGYEPLETSTLGGLRIRCHGDYHLGQVLYTGHDFVIIDFEGEPARPLRERRAKHSPLRDVAGMVRSYHYASHAARMEYRSQHPQAEDDHLRTVGRAWYQWVASRFLAGYFQAMENAPCLPSDPAQQQRLLNAYVLEKAIYELAYELNNRPDWVRIPLEGILELVEA